MLRQLRNFWIPITTFVLVCFGNAFAQTSYRMTDLGTVGTDNESMIMSLNNEGLSYIMAGNVGGLGPNNLFGQLQNGHAYLGVGRYLFDLGTLGGQNTWMNWGEINDWAQIVGYSETNVPDPNGEDICGFGTHKTCSPFLWQDFHMSPLPTLGGNNGQASAINNRGQIVGMAEDGTVDSTCPANTTKPLPGGYISAIATGINNQGQVVGSIWNSDFNRSHAFIYQDGVMTYLDTLFPASSNLSPTMANKINDRGQISGMGTVNSGPDKGKVHAFLATPVNESVNANQLLQRFGLGRLHQ